MSSIKSFQMLRGNITASQALNGKVATGKVQVVDKMDLYEGSYVITPTVESQIVGTKEKFLKEDITIKEIPFFNVGNESGGSTVYIGKEI